MIQPQSLYEICAYQIAKKSIYKQLPEHSGNWFTRQIDKKIEHAWKENKEIIDKLWEPFISQENSPIDNTETYIIWKELCITGVIRSENLDRLRHLPLSNEYDLQAADTIRLNLWFTAQVVIACLFTSSPVFCNFTGSKARCAHLITMPHHLKDKVNRLFQDCFRGVQIFHYRFDGFYEYGKDRYKLTTKDPIEGDWVQEELLDDDEDDPIPEPQTLLEKIERIGIQIIIRASPNRINAFCTTLVCAVTFYAFKPYLYDFMSYLNSNDMNSQPEVIL